MQILDSDKLSGFAQNELCEHRYVYRSKTKNR